MTTTTITPERVAATAVAAILAGPYLPQLERADDEMSGGWRIRIRTPAGVSCGVLRVHADGRRVFHDTAEGIQELVESAFDPRWSGSIILQLRRLDLARRFVAHAHSGNADLVAIFDSKDDLLPTWTPPRAALFHHLVSIATPGIADELIIWLTSHSPRERDLSGYPEAALRWRHAQIANCYLRRMGAFPRVQASPGRAGDIDMVPVFDSSDVPGAGRRRDHLPSWRIHHEQLLPALSVLAIRSAGAEELEVTLNSLQHGPVDLADWRP